MTLSGKAIAMANSRIPPPDHHPLERPDMAQTAGQSAPKFETELERELFEALDQCVKTLSALQGGAGYGPRSSLPCPWRRS